MRPLRLELEGFTAFRQRTCIDFNELDLFAITGPTGAGKSSIIDAIVYALYGRVPRVNAAVGACISLGMERLWVSLEFSAGQSRYRVFRETRVRGAPNVRLERCTNGDWEPIAQQAGPVTQQVQRILGLDFEAFTRSVLLPQGQFAEFLGGKPEVRRQVLHRLLRLEVYERLRELAGARARDAKQQVDAIERRLREDYADVAPETLALRRQELKQAEKAAAAHEARRGALEACLAVARELDSALTDASRARQDAADARTEAAGARAVIADGDAPLTAVRERIEAVRAALDENAFDPDLLERLTSAANIALALERAERELVGLRGQLAVSEAASNAAVEACKKAGVALEAARDAHRAAQARYEEARRHDLAAALRSGLRPGDPCPVCGAAVGELPTGAAPALEQAEAALTAARSAEQRAQADLTAAEREAGVKAERAAAFRGQVAKAEADVVQRRSELDAALPGVQAPGLAAVQAALGVQRDARGERERLIAEERQALREKETIEVELSQARGRLAAAEGRLAGAEKVLQEAEAAAAAARRRLEEATLSAGLDDLTAALATGAAPLDLLQSRRDAALREEREALTSVGALREAVKGLEEDIERKAALERELAVHKKALDVADDLAWALRADRFQAYVQEEALRALAGDGSRRLEELAEGRYALTLSGGGQDFEVIDRWNGDEARSVKTLSGGETFLASLALALALADSLPRLGAAAAVELDSVFLDEGFGSLDREALDRAADALDALRAGGRMVCVVTHLPELAQRLPARIHVEKSETGSTVSLH